MEETVKKVMGTPERAGDSETPLSIGFERRLAGRSVEDAYRTIVAWLQEQKATIKAARPPTFVEATHGRAFQPMGWRKDAPKTLAFEILPAGRDVLVNVRITPPALNAPDVRMHPEEARANWNELLAELWIRFGETGALAEAIQRPPGDWNATLARGRSFIVGGVVLLAIGIVVFLATTSLSRYMILVRTGPLVGGALMLLYGAITVNQAKRRLARPGP